MRIKFGTERRNDWKCLFCCHVRTGTILLGIWHLVLNVLALSVIAVFLFHPEFLAKKNTELAAREREPVLPTPLSEVDEPRQPILEIMGSDLSSNMDKPRAIPNRDESLNTKLDCTRAYSYRDFLGNCRLKYQDLKLGFAVTFCTFIITLLMVLGAVKGKPSYLMPFFCLQVFDFCIASLTAIGYFCYLPDVRQVISSNPDLPFRKELLRMDPQCLSLLVLLAFVGAMMVKAYFIGVVWNCYKYLTLRNAAAQRTIHYIDPDSQSLLPDLPDYDTAINDPRFYKKPLYPTPPPSYTIAMAAVPVSQVTVETPITEPTRQAQTQPTSSA